MDSGAYMSSLPNQLLSMKSRRGDIREIECEIELPC